MSIAGGAEIAFIALLTFVIVGPKDLPKLLFFLGRFIQGVRQLSHEFMAEFEVINHIRECEEDNRTSPKERQ